VPQRGAVHLDGRDITFATATDRVQRGISQVPGGKAVFGPMSVVENLRVYGYALGSDRAAVDRGIDTAFEVFPRLNERRNQTAQTLSGGEQQMLALSKALILEPRLLLIDELSLGLAPVIVSQLLDMVRTINERGTAVVLVEQSVNVALSLAQHAYYMEKGEIRFDGPTAELLERPDVLRSVYLKGAADGLGAGA
jgi:ABC-type branched-subunit amino acid transport system ATPase component